MRRAMSNDEHGHGKCLVSVSVYVAEAESHVWVSVCVCAWTILVWFEHKMPSRKNYTNYYFRLD